MSNAPKPNKATLRKVRKLCEKFDCELQALFDQMDEATYATETCQNAVQAQAYANDAALAGES